jgi:Protein of unknown function (DUF3105)
MASRKEEKERLRQQRLAAERAAASRGRSRLIAGYVVAGILAAAVLAGLVAVIASGGSDGGIDACENAHIQNSGGTFQGLEADCREGTTPPPIRIADLSISAEQAGCELKLDLPEEGRTHVPSSQSVQYKTVPPTSGNHNPVPINDGAYTTPITDNPDQGTNIRSAVHALEHGRVEIQYKPSLPQNQQLALKGVFDEESGGMLLFPNPDMPYDVAVTSWQNEVTCPTYNETVLDVIRNFRDTYLGNGPEQVPTDLG